MVTTNFATTPDGFQYLSQFDQAFAQCMPTSPGNPWYDVTAFGADPTGVNDSTAAVQAVINKISTGTLPAGVTGGVVFFPPGNYWLKGGITLTNVVCLRGSGMDATNLFAWYNDVTVITCGASWTNASIEALSVFAKGVNNDTTTFGASTTTAAVTMAANSGINCVFRDVQLEGGYYNLNTAAVDCVFENLICPGGSFGPAQVNNTGDNWWIRCKLDADPVAQAITSSQPYSNWSATASVTAGQAVVTQGYIIVYTHSGTTGGSAPTLKNFGINITDGTATAQLVSASTYSAITFNSPAAENSLYQVDMSGDYTTSFIINSASAFVEMRSIIFTNATITTASRVLINGSHFAGTVTMTSASNFVMSDCYGVSTVTMTVGSSNTNFMISNTDFAGGTVTIGTGCSNYSYGGNTNVIITDDSGSNVPSQNGPILASGGFGVTSEGGQYLPPSSFASCFYATAVASGPILYSYNFATSSHTPTIWNGLSWDFRPSASTSTGWTLAANVLSPDADNVTTLGTATQSPSIVYSHEVISPLVVGGSATGTALVIKSTSAGSPSGDSVTVEGSSVILRAQSGASTVYVGVAGVSSGSLSIAGSSTGATIIQASATATGTLTMQAVTDTIAVLGTTQNFSAAQTFTSIVGSTSVLITGQGGVGYAAGSGGTVTQTSSKATAVTLNKISGEVTMNNAALSAAAIVSFAMTNTSIAASDVMVLNHVSGGTPGSYTLNAQPAAGSATINVRNNTAGTLSEAIVLGFVVIKGAIS